MIRRTHTAATLSGRDGEITPTAKIGWTLLPAMLLAIAILFAGAHGASAQSYDPDIGTGNIAPVYGGGYSGYSGYAGGYSGFAQGGPGWTMRPFHHPRRWYRRR